MINIYTGTLSVINSLCAKVASFKPVNYFGVSLLALMPVPVSIAHTGHIGVDPEAPQAKAYFESVFNDIKNVYTEPASNAYQSVINELDNEYIDTFSGLLQLKYADIIVPANGGLDLVAQRNYLGLQPHQFDSMTAMQRNISGLGWQVHFGKLISTSYNNHSICDSEFDSPVTQLETIINDTIAELQPNSARDSLVFQERLETIRSLLSQRVLFTDQQLTDMRQVAKLGAHDIAEALSDIVETTDQEEYDLTDLVPGNDTTSTDLVRFLIDLIEPLSLVYTTRDSIAFEMPDGSRHSFFRDDISGDRSLMTLSRLKLRCEENQMIVLTPNGTKYSMVEYENFIGQRQPSEYSNWLSWGEHSWYVSDIEDVHGNKISLSYLENNKGIKYITKVTSSDTSVPAIEYFYENIDTDQLRLSSIESGSKKWVYTYQTVTKTAEEPSDQDLVFNVLDTVTRPDGRIIDYDYDSSTFQLVKMTSPYGAIVDYKYQDIDVFPTLNGIIDDSQKLYSALESKMISGPDIDAAEWSFEFAPASFNNSNSENSFDITTVIEPYAKSTYYFYSGSPEIDSLTNISNWASVNQSLNLAVEKQPLDTNDSSRVATNRTFNTRDVRVSSQRYSNGISLTDYYTVAVGATPGEVNSGINLPVVSSQSMSNELNVQLLEGGSTFSFANAYGNFDNYGFPKSLIEYKTGYDNSGASNRTHTITYKNDPINWILGLADKDIVSNGLNSLVVDTVYKSNGLPESVSRSGVVTQFTYYPNGEVETIEDANGHISAFSDYASGIPKSVTNAENETTIRTVNSSGTVSSVKDPLSNITKFEYDDLDRIVLITPAIKAATSIVYDNSDFLRTTIRGELIQTEEFDVRGRLVKKSVNGIVTTNFYDLINRTTFASNPNSTNGQTYKYDGINRLVSSTDPLGNQFNYQYDPNFDQVIINNKRGIETRKRFMRYGFDSLLTSIIEPINDDEDRLTRMSHDLTGQITKVFQGNDLGLEREFIYDEKFFLDKKIEPETGVTDYSTDLVGNITSSAILRNDLQTEYKYDKANRLTLINYPEGTDDIVYSYYENGLLESAQTGAIRNEYNYDKNNNLASELLNIGGRFPRNFELSYDYDELDNLSTITYPNGLVVEYNPDVLGRPQQVGTLASNVQFTDDGQLSSLTMANGRTLSYGYDDRLMPNSIVTPGVVDFSYLYDPGGNVSSINNVFDPTQNVTFGADSYDGIDRLQSVETSPLSVGSITHQYDALGSLQKIEIGQASEIQESNYQTNGNTLQAVINTSVSKPNIELNYDTYGHIVNKNESLKNSEGNVTQRLNKQFNYDDASRLETVEFLSAAGQNRIKKRAYQYDAHKQRVVNEVPGTYDLSYSFYSISGDLMFEELIETCDEISNIRLGSMLLARNVKTSFESTQDSDDDSLNDCLESISGLDPSDSSDASLDSDGDGITNADELLEHGTTINNSDSDDDGRSDGLEVAQGSNPNQPDSDGDGLDDSLEYTLGLSAINADTDFDGVADGTEQTSPFDPIDSSDGVLDFDSDGFSNRQEDLLGFDPTSIASMPTDEGMKTWVFDGIGSLKTSPVVGPDRTLYYATASANVYAVHPNGKLKWSFETQDSIHGSLVLDPNNQTLFVGIANGMLVALSLDGEVKWQVDTNLPILASPSIDPKGNVYIAIDNNVLSYDLEGNERWTQTLTGSVGLQSHLAISSEGIIYVGDSAANVTAINSDNGQVEWVQTLTGDFSQASPALFNDGTIHIAGSDGQLHQLRSTGRLNWSRQFSYAPDAAEVISSPVIDTNGNVYIGGTDAVNDVPTHKVVAYSSLGTLQWSYDQLYGAASTPSIATDGTIYASDYTGRLHAINVDGTQQWMNNQFSSNAVGSPVVDQDGTIYLGLNDGRVGAYSDNTNGAPRSWSSLSQGGLNSGHQCQGTGALYNLVDDLDGDGFPDCYEWVNGLQVTDPTDGQVDTDNDGLSDGQEYYYGTNPNLIDSDYDGITDGDEVANGTNPTDWQPFVGLLEPNQALTTFEGKELSFRAYASDSEDGTITDLIQWRSQLDGLIGTGGSILTSALSIGQHTISAEVTDSGGSLASATVEVTINFNEPPVVEITDPNADVTYQLGELVTFAGSAVDVEDGGISMSIKWNSSLDGALGMGASIGDNLLSVGQHVITAEVTDSGQKTSSTTVGVFIDYDPDGDADGDGLTNQEEIDLGTNPINEDTDHDLLDDFTEVSLDTNPLHDYGESMADYDYDGFSNRQENTTGTDLLDPASTPTLGALMWSNESALYGRGLALSNDSALHTGGTTFYADGVPKQIPEMTLLSQPTVANSGSAYYPEECSLYKVSESGKTELFSNYTYDENNGGFCFFGPPSVNTDESLIVVATGAAYDQGGYLGFDSFGNVAINFSTDTYDFTYINAIGYDDSVYLFPEDVGYFYRYDGLGNYDWEANSSRVSGFAIGEDNDLYHQPYNLLSKVNDLGGSEWEFPLFKRNFDDMTSILIGENNEVYTAGWPSDDFSNSSPYSLFKIDTETGVGQELTFVNAKLGFIGKNNLLYTNIEMDGVDYIQASDSNGLVIWRSDNEVSFVGTHSFYRNDKFVVDADGTLITVSNDQMKAYVTDSQGLANSQWPKLGHDNRNSNHQPGPVVPDAAQILMPQKGRRIITNNVTITWTDTAAERYELYIDNGGEIQSVTLASGTTSYDVSNIVRNGMPIKVTLDSVFTGNQVSKDTAIFQTDAEQVSETAEVQSPVSGTLLDTSAPTFIWNNVGAERYRFWVGSSVGAKDIKVAWAGSMKSSKVINGLPLDGSTLYVRFFTKKEGEWTYNDYEYTAHTDSEPQVSQLVSPLNNSLFNSPYVEFEWLDVSAEKYRFWFGSSLGAKDIKVAWANGEKVSKKINDLPLDGSQIYLRFATKKYGQWQYVDYEFSAHTDFTPQVAELLSPVDGSVWTSPHINFEWQDIVADKYRLWFGSAPGLNDIDRAWIDGSKTSKLVKSLPHDGSPIYVRLSSKKYGRWKHKDYAYTTLLDPIDDTSQIVSHSNGASLSGDTVTFNWSNVEAERYRILVGNARNGKEIDVKTLKNPALTEYTVSGLPVDGSTVFVTLRTYKYGVWTSNFYEFKAASN